MLKSSKSFWDVQLFMGLNSLSTVIVVMIDMPTLEIVFIRTLITFLVLGAYIQWKKFDIRLNEQMLVKLLSSGLLISLYWTMLFMSAKIGNASVSMIGIATTSIWVSLMNPIIQQRKISRLEIMLGGLTLVAMGIMVQTQSEDTLSLVLAIAAGFFAALFTIFSSDLSKNQDFTVITFYQMIGAWVGAILFFPIYINFFSENLHLNMVPSLKDLFWIMILVVMFSIILHRRYLYLMKEISPFYLTLSANLSPVYGMIAALLIFGGDEVMDLPFYLGTILMISALGLHSILRKPDGTKKTEG